MTRTSLVYGLALEHLPAHASELCGTSTCDDPVVPVEILAGDEYRGATDSDLYVDDNGAVIRLAEGWLDVTRWPSPVIRYYLDRPLTDEALVHPYLAFPAAVVSHWLGRVALHAGALIVDGVAIAILGTKEAGKSSTMAAAARAGFDVLSDDLLVIDAGDALAGPRAIDLRADAADAFGESRYLGTIGARERWRLPVSAGSPSAPLRAIVTLGWGDRIEARSLAMHERVGPVLESCALGAGWLSPSAAFDLFAVPAWEVLRPRDLDGIDDFVATIASLVRDDRVARTR
jgi:hypothetical protein